MKNFGSFIFNDKTIPGSLRDESIPGGDTYFTSIYESTLSRLLDAAKNKDFAIITAYRGDPNAKTKEEKRLVKARNVHNNQELRQILNSKKLGSYALVGTWQECEDDTIPYDQCPKDKLKVQVERSYFIPRHYTFSPNEFKTLLFNLAKKYNQDAIVLKINALNLNGVYDSKTEKELVKFEKTIALNKLSQAYSRFIKKLNVPFVFEGVETPHCLNIGKKAFRDDGFLW